jgi:Xaa-Pro aminopeptidase
MELFSKLTYKNRRTRLANRVKSGLILILGNNDAPMNYTDNIYRFRQDSNFLYFFGINQPSLAATIDVETRESIVYGREHTIEDIIWIGPHPTLRSYVEKVGVEFLKPFEKLQDDIAKAINQKRKIHFLPPYRHDNMLLLMKLMGVTLQEVKDNVSVELVKAVIDLRSYKSAEEIKKMEDAVNTARAMHIAAMENTKPGEIESSIVGVILNEAHKKGCHLSYPAIFTINGQTLHNHDHGNIMNEGHLALNDSGAEHTMGYAADITRTFPVNGLFSSKQKEIYNIVLEMEESSIQSLKPGLQYKDVHIESNRILLERFKELGLLSGGVGEMLNAGVGGLFMPHGLGHMIGLDVHDMEDLGENLVGYREGLERETQLGLKSLRLARELEEGFVLTVEPGIYFIPQLIEKWKSENQFTNWINYQKLEEYYDFGGIRIEDNVLVTNDAYRVLGNPIPKSTDEIEELMN